MQFFEETKDIILSIKKTVAIAKKSVSPSLNFLLSDGRNLFAYRYSLKDKSDFHLHYLKQKLIKHKIEYRSKKTNEKIGAISYSELYDYLRTNQKTASTSYLQYIYSVNSLDVFKEFPISNYLSKSIDTTKEYFILTGMAKEGWLISSSIFSLNPFSLGNTPYPVVILEKTTENYNAVGCEDFVTKAG